MYSLPCECDRLLLCLAKTLGLFSRRSHRASHGILDIGLFLNMSHDSGPLVVANVTINRTASLGVQLE